MSKKIEVPKTIKATTIGRADTPDQEGRLPHRDGEPEIAPPGWKSPHKTTIYLYQRDENLIKDYQKQLKKDFGKVSKLEIIRYALNTLNIKRFKVGY